MIYEYYCYLCDEDFVGGNYPMGMAPQTRACPKCKRKCGRSFKVNVHIPNPTHEARKGRGKG